MWNNVIIQAVECGETNPGSANSDLDNGLWDDSELCYASISSLIK